MKKIGIPPPVAAGSKIAIIAPAGSVEPAQLEETLSMISDRGFIPVLGKYLYGKYQFGYEYSGTEEERTYDLQWALNDKEIKAVWAARGGYGCQHLVEKIDLLHFKKNPKWYIGYSDNTILHSYLLKNGFASINGQTIKTSSFGVAKQSYDEIFDMIANKPPKYLVKDSKWNKPGSVEGRLVGGNLALVYALLGSEYEYKWEESILFIEDIGEQYYSLDRMLMSLEMAGIFDKIGGLIIGGMINMGEKLSNVNYEESFDLFSNQLVAHRVKEYNFPTLFNFPNGHIYENRPLIIGAKIKLTVGANNLVEYSYE